MKFKKTILLASSLLMLASCNKNNPPDIKDVVIDQETSDSDVFTVTIPTGEGFTFEGSSTVKQNENYSFKIKAKAGYDISDIVVKVNGNVLPLNSNSYLYYNVQSDLTIEVSGVKLISRITLTNKKFFYKLGQVPNDVKTEEFFKTNAKGTYGTNTNANIEVDISDVDFDNTGCYPVYYYLEDNPEYYEIASVCIMDVDSSFSISVDLADISNGGISSLYGVAFSDFEIKDSSGNALTSEDIHFDVESDLNVFSAAFLSKLTTGVEHSFTISYIGFDQTVTVKLTLTDNGDPNFVFTHLESEYAFVAGNVTLPSATKSPNSAQNITVKYFVNGVEHSYNECINLVSSEGDYQFSIKFYKDNTEINGFSKNYTIHVINDPNDYLTFGSSSSGRAKVEISNKGNFVIRNDGAAGLDLQVSFNETFMEKYNTSHKNILYVDLKVTSVNTIPTQSIWYMDGKDVVATETAANRFNSFIDRHPTHYIGAGPDKGFVLGSTFRVPLYVGSTGDDSINSFKTCLPHLILRDFNGTIEVTKFFFLNNNEEINAATDFLSGTGSFASYTNVSAFNNDECVFDDDISNSVVSFTGDFFEIKGNNLFSKLQSQDDYKRLEFDIKIESLDINKTATAVYAAHGGWASWEEGCLELDNNHTAHISIDLKQYLFDINSTSNNGNPFVLFLRFYGSTSVDKNNISVFEGSSKYIKPCKFVITNFSLSK